MGVISNLPYVVRTNESPILKWMALIWIRLSVDSEFTIFSNWPWPFAIFHSHSITNDLRIADLKKSLIWPLKWKLAIRWSGVAKRASIKHEFLPAIYPIVAISLNFWYLSAKYPPISGESVLAKLWASKITPTFWFTSPSSDGRIALIRNFKLSLWLKDYETVYQSEQIMNLKLSLTAWTRNAFVTEASNTIEKHKDRKFELSIIFPIDFAKILKSWTSFETPEPFCSWIFSVAEITEMSFHFYACTLVQF